MLLKDRLVEIGRPGGTAIVTTTWTVAPGVGIGAARGATDRGRR